ncbi:MAG: hypothetical protein ONB46_04685 [candidate division KSB1 bacterium]|nr:hypothetical protein [candidate division KSB1 bacterium]MDZ7369376.1 hypothetical protein [candidate division KSB1 bacterium]MDZ7403212.1 hypothetical protein [candidate division KSB1 bacterium]
MRYSMQWLLTIAFIVVGGIFLGALGLALAGAAAGWLVNSGKRGFGMAASVAAIFWLVVAVIKVLGGKSPQLLALAGSLANLSGPKAWLLVLVSGLMAFFAGGLGGWLGGSLRQVMSKPTSQQPAS